MIPAILIPIIGGLLIPLFPKGSEKIRNIFAGAVSSVPQPRAVKIASAAQAPEQDDLIAGNAFRTSD